MLNNIFNEITVGVGLLFTVVLFLFYYMNAKSRQLLSYIPNIWTSLGILGTFIAIVISLDTGNNDNFGSINQLVGDIIPAFQTSIIGIIGAIITSVIVKILFAIEDKKEENKYRSEVNENISPELFLNRMHLSLEKNNSLLRELISLTQLQQREVINEMVSQKDTLKEFLDGFIHQLRFFYSEIFETTSEHAKVVIDGYLHGIKQVIDPMHTDIVNHIDGLLATHTQAINDYMQEEDRNLAKISSGIIAALNANSEAVVSSIKCVEETELNNIKNLTAAFNSEMNQILQSIKNHIQEENKKFADISEGIITSLNANSEIVISSIKCVEETELNNIKSITATFNSEMNQISQSITNHIKEENKKLADISEGIITSLNTNSEVVISSIKCVEETELNNVRSLAGTFNLELNSTTQSFISSLDSVKLQITELVDKLPDQLVDFKQDLINSMRQIIVDKYSLLLEEHNAFSGNVLKKVKEFEENVSRQAKREGAEWLKDVRDELQQMMDVLDKNIKSNANLIGKLIHEMNGDMTTVVSSLSSSSENYKTIVNQIGRFLPSLERGSSRC
ncbi:MotA/TolQ/ExbB proton channel family protein [Bacteroides thetaiotaomicron]|uniref:MotA/TolQ/ExbB proton channel family protein n=1 Tax=Bacteroides thetaiotaomicron TaxID=818 RepID=UPI0023306A7A|nr:MotA/TolQ/ExbB proton channel family protein [Bacteroides thetaiotaomicron]MDC2009070.1 MotA/TolQ/ExbB proton channel family protein [Bacteroides thetaiotaomicron]MDC2023212.1 MotA/TolQ/ExbB proton channel family protein [Bacteroides thetaiotaomicron]MDC2025814.1 MotA/TolQ/ExbB proton channel family protein [Bacteroides thetaiotaomicron]MDC2032324.1 MotA/TolQ/ExbB proton channel family protein [Bacteroides thetaiotaomicron]MDC2063287.1 MotA/TolQ/ExbB proton channel family protein [Bacteroid